MLDFFQPFAAVGIVGDTDGGGYPGKGITPEDNGNIMIKAH
ncbi:hypothetical protein SDC9_171542 [bioreactor metagenome]|uniref:Uncharacterized protein n=1 Tax=bioreactor metagenome TaxID=1076179 RepID=A0A645GB51_9ZZZZ